MNNPFSPKNAPVNRPKRNVFDLSHANNLTMKFGTLYPVLSLPVLPGDSFKIDSNAMLKAMPLQFPIQTRLTLAVHYFYVRNRNLWNHWMDYIGHSEQSFEHPWLKNPSRETIGSCKLGDYLGVPTTQGVLQSESVSYTNFISPASRENYLYASCSACFGKSTSNYLNQGMYSVLGGLGASPDFIAGVDTYTLTNNTGNATLFKHPVSKPVVNNFVLSGTMVLPREGFIDSTYYLLVSFGPSSFERSTVRLQYDLVIDSDNSDTTKTTFKLSEEDFKTLSDSDLWDSRHNAFFTFVKKLSTGSVDSHSTRIGKLSSSSPYQVIFDSSFIVNLTYTSFLPVVKEALESPFIGDSPSIPLNALPFRAYEQIFNFFYRNEFIDPYVVDGVKEYNKFSNQGDGADTFEYKLHQRNWELDFLTGCVKSPQAGEAPLVGVTVRSDSTADIHFEKIIGDEGSTEIEDGYMTVKVDVEDDGSITGISSYSEDIPSANLRRLQNYILQGISINDLRNVNAFQRFLENTQRKGFRYREQIMSHFGVAPDPADINVPEFIGGYTVDLNANQISQTVENDVAPLGSYAGQLQGYGSQKHSVSHYCPEHGYIMAIASIIPAASYSQVLPLDMTKVNDKFEHYYPEFGKIGFVPVDYRTICPVETYNAQQSLNDTFGYQRAWWDYMSIPDSIHGDYRLSLRDFLVNRVFASKPELSKQFIEIRPEDVNNIFAVTDAENDPFFGQIYFSIKAQRPIPRFAVPSLE